jgi:hypothetical protein
MRKKEYFQRMGMMCFNLLKKKSIEELYRIKEKANHIIEKFDSY